MMKEYFNNAAETDDLIHVHADGIRWAHTGDIGKIDEDGFLTIVGRSKRIITVIDDNGIYHKVYPRTLEDAILRENSVLEIAIVGKPSENKNNHIVAFVVCQKEDVETIEQLKIFSANSFEAWEQPLEYRTIEKLPRTLIGKVDYRTLEALAAEEANENS